MLKVVLILLFICVGQLRKAQAYPHFVGHGYTSCITCHYNPFGNGPLNDYGRALSATAVSSRMFYNDKKTEEQIAQSSNFFMGGENISWLRPDLDYRGMYIQRSMGTENESSEIIHMNAMASATILLKQDYSLFATGSIAYSPVPLTIETFSDEEVSNYRSREHYIGWRPAREFGIYAGLMDKVYGLRIAEHNAYSRSTTGLAQNDQSHGVQFHWTPGKNWELGLGVFVGNLSQDAELRQKGFSGKFDYKLDHKRAVGLSLLKSASEFVEQEAVALHYMGAVGKGSAVLLEFGQSLYTPANESSDASDTTIKQYYRYGLTGLYLKMFRGLYLINAVEYIKRDPESYTLRFAPGIQWFPIQRVELKAEIYNTRNFSEQSASEDDWSLLTQLHLWF